MSSFIKNQMKQGRLRFRILWISLAAILISSVPISKYMLYSELHAVTDQTYDEMDTKALALAKQIKAKGSVHAVEDAFFEGIIAAGEKISVDEGSTGSTNFVGSVPDQKHSLSRQERQSLSYYIPSLFKQRMHHYPQINDNSKKAFFAPPKMFIDEGMQVLTSVQYSFPIDGRMDTVRITNNITKEITMPFNTFISNLTFMVIWFWVLSIIGTYFILRLVFKPLEKTITNSFNKDNPNQLHIKIKDPNHGKEVSGIIESFNSLLDNYYELAQQNLNTMQDVSHEVKTHLTSIKQSVDVIKMYGKEDPDLLKGKLDAIESNIVRVSTIMTAILDLARLKQGLQGIRPTAYEAQYLTNHFLNYKRRTHPGVDIRTAFETNDDKICIEREHFYLALNPIFENAVKYSCSSQQILVSVCPGENDKTIRISITNYGSYIQPGDLPYLFDRYYRGANSASDKTGSGLGLTITKEVTDIYGGAVNVTSDDKGVTTFMVDFVKA